MKFHVRSLLQGISRFWFAVAIIMVIATVFRFTGLNWDEGHYFHPDERFIATVMDGRLSMPDSSNFSNLLDPARSPLNTRSDGEDGIAREFAYGSLPFLIATMIGELLGGATGRDLTSYQHVGQFGRVLTALVDLGTVAIVILFARRLSGDLAGLIAGSLVACSVVLIQLAHFFTVDTWVTFFSIATLYASHRLSKRFEPSWTLAAGILGGAALATKVSVGVLGIPILIAMIAGASRTATDWRQAVSLLVRRLALAAVGTVTTFAIFEPYALWRPSPFIRDIRTQWEIVNGHFDVPFTRQFVGTISGVNEIENLVLWGIAPGFGVAALAATGIAIYHTVKQRNFTYLLLLSWIIPYFYVIASSEARFLRYSAPLVPPLAILVADLLANWWRASSGQPSRRYLPGLAITSVISIALLWAVMFMSVYFQTHPRVDASTWIYENVPPGSTLTHEVWDDRLPVRVGMMTGGIYDYRAMDLYTDRTNVDAVSFIREVLHEADYIVLASQRLSHSIPRLPWRYPVQTAYYRLLHNEQLGFELAYEATSYPRLGPVEINTLGADESFSVYDHTPVWVFRKVEQLSTEEIELRFAQALNQTRHVSRQPPEPNLLLSSPVQDRSVQPAPGWSAPITGHSMVATVAWLLALGLVTLAAFPLTLRLLSAFEDLGVGFAPLIGLLVTGAIVFIVWSLQLGSFSLITGLLVLGLLATATWMGPGAPDDWRNRLLEARTAIIGSSLAFMVGFGFFLLLRAINPDLWHPFYGGEKPMDTAYLNAIASTGDFPPHDPWFAGGAINYYYYGFFLFGILAHITGIELEIVYQLSLASIAGLLCAGLFSLGMTLTRFLLRTASRRWTLAGGAMSVLIVVFTGNLDSGLNSIREFSLQRDFWASSRVVSFAINEFPYFSLLYGDVHAHLVAAPILVLIVAMGLAWLANPDREDSGWIALWAGMSGVVLGSVYVTNTWDAPVAGMILLTAVSVALIRDGAFSRWNLLNAIAAIATVLLVAFAVFSQFHRSFEPQTDGLRTTENGIAIGEWTIHFGGLLAPMLVVVALFVFHVLRDEKWSRGGAAVGAAIGLTAFAGGVTISSGLMSTPLLIGGAVLVAVVGALLVGIARAAGSDSLSRVSLGLVVLAVGLGGTLAPARPVAAVSTLILAAFALLWLRGRGNPGRELLAIAGAAAAGLILVADMVFIADHLQHSEWQRMNTVFKLYFQSWSLLGIVAAMATVWLLYQTRQWIKVSNSTGRGLSLAHPALLTISSAAGVILLLLWFAYPILATPDRLGRDMESSPAGITLRGYEWMDGGELRNAAGDTIELTGDFAAIKWLREEVGGNPVILEASIGAYRGGGSRYSSATGMPAVLGWDSHQSQQRGGEMVATRMRDVREMYQTSDIDRKRWLLRQYAIDFVIVGDIERYTVIGQYVDGEDPDYYASKAGLDAFEQMVGEDLEIAFQSGNTTIYRVLPFPAAGTIR